MSVENDELLIVQPEEQDTIPSKQSKISYTREFLLSFSELEVCKRLPKGFDKSLLSEFEDASHVIQDQSRISGCQPLQGFRRNDYGSSPPGKREISHSSRGLHRWDSRSTGQSDTDSLPDRDSDLGRRYGNQYRRPWQNSEHDGLLGSGSCPRPPGYGPVGSASRFRANEQYQLSKSNDPYHPPRPYKAIPHSRREINDSNNDETFGSTECMSDDRVEEEKKRRAEFEMMRKEQQKELQEKLKLKSVDKLKDDPLYELANSSDTRDAKMANGLVEPVMKQIQQSDSLKISASSQGQPSRPLVPPGFANISMEKISAAKPLSHSAPAQVEMPEIGEGNQEEKSALQLGLRENHLEVTSSSASKGGRRLDLSFACEFIQESVPVKSFRASESADICNIVANGKVMRIDSGNITGHKIMGEAGRSTSLLEQLFGGSLSIESSNVSTNVEDQNLKTDDVWSPKDFRSSKFAHLFLEEEKKQMEDKSSENSHDLLSLIVGERGGPVASETNTMQQMPLESNSCTPKSIDAGISEPLHIKNKPEVISAVPIISDISAVLTCEDLEQSILSEIGESSFSSQPPGDVSSPPELRKLRSLILMLTIWPPNTFFPCCKRGLVQAQRLHHQYQC